VKEAAERPLIWPPTLKRPLTGRPVVYLDLNHWISLAKAAVGHAQGDDYMANALLEFERGYLRGPQDEAELQKLQSLGYDHNECYREPNLGPGRSMRRV